MGLVIFAPTPSFACEKMRLLRTRARAHTHTHTLSLRPTRATVYFLFIDSVMLLFFPVLSRTFMFPLLYLFVSSFLGICRSSSSSSRSGLFCDCEAAGILSD